MGRGRKGSGVEPRANDYRIRFTWHGKRYVMVEPLRPCAPHYEAAKRKARDIKRAIDDGSFTLERFFPESEEVKQAAAAAQAEKAASPTVGTYLDRFLASKSALAAATLSQYAGAAKHWKARELRKDEVLGGADCADVKHSELSALVGKVAWPSARMRNNSLIVLRGAFDLWVADDRRHRDSPMEGIENAKFQKGNPDPFTPDEAEAIIARAYEKYPEQIGAYLEFAIFSFVRPEEEIAILWTKVDQLHRKVKIDVAKTFKGTVKAVKTYEERELELAGNDRAWAALMRMKKYTYMKEGAAAFQNPRTMKDWHDERSQRDHYLKPILKYLGIRERRAYCTRHTGITLALLAGCDPQWVARQAGHKNTKMIWEVYSKWIPGQDQGSESKKMGARYGGKTAPEEIGLKLDQGPRRHLENVS